MIIKSDLFIWLISWFIKAEAITLYPFIILSPKRITKRMMKSPMGMSGYQFEIKKLINHEKIHLAQQKELYVIGFYVLYVYYFIRGCIKQPTITWAYYLNPFELEAYKNQASTNYLRIRKDHAWRKYL